MPSQITNYQCPACTGPLHYSGSTCRMDMRLRPDGCHRQFLPELRQQKARAEARGRKLEVPAVRRDGNRKVLPRMRHKKARSTGRRLDVQLRRGKQGKVLRRMRQTETGRRSAVQMRQVRLGAG